MFTGIVGEMGEIGVQQAEPGLDRRQRVVDLVGDHRRHPPDGGVALGAGD